MFGKEPSMRDQLVEARSKIVEQLDEMNFRANAKGFARRGGPPDYSGLIIELESQLREIDALLDADNSTAS